MMNLAEAVAHHARARPSHVALIAGDQEISYRDFYPLVLRTAAALRRVGAREGDLVALALKDTIEHVTLFYALARIGAVILPVDWRWTPEEQSRVAGHFGARFALIQPGADIPGVPGVAVGPDWRESITREREADDFPRDGQAPLLVSLSSGTTGQPKGPLLTHHQFFRRFMTHWINLNFNSQDRYISAMPLYFGGGRTFSMSVLFAGGTVILYPPPYEPLALAGEVAKRDATSLFLVPTLIRRLLELSRDEAAPLRQLRLLLSSGSALHAEERRDIRNRLCPNFFEYYASTEGGGVSLLTPQDLEQYGGSVGRPVFGVDVEIVDDEHRPLPAGETGRLRYRGPAVATGFFGEPEQNAETFRDGWFYPGDLASLNAEGYVFLRGRAKDMIIRGGVNIYPVDVEAALLEHPAVAEAAVVGLPDKEFGEQVAAFIVPRETIEDAALFAWCRERLAAYKAPKFIFRVDEMPRNAAGKILKQQLVARAAAPRERS
jgi:long-chain acyl-CoA synthetase